VKIFASVPSRAATRPDATNKLQEIVQLLFSRFPLAKRIHPSLPAKSAPPLLPRSTPGYDRPRAFAAFETKHSCLQRLIAGNALCYCHPCRLTPFPISKDNFCQPGSREASPKFLALPQSPSVQATATTIVHRRLLAIPALPKTQYLHRVQFRTTLKCHGPFRLASRENLISPRHSGRYHLGSPMCTTLAARSSIART